MKLKYESKIKEINEAYETLSDNSKKEIYDNSLKNSENDFNNLYQENINLKNELNNLKNNSYKNTTSNFKNDNYNNLNNISENNINNNYKNNNLKDYFQNTLKKAYHDAYIDDMKNSLKDIIVGEDKAIDNLIDITKRIRCGYNDRCYSLLFVGSSGVGKSRLAKEYANILVGADNLIRMDMSEYSDSTAINKILGSSPGYIGYDDNKNILEEIRNKPNSVLLLDEIDKAHPNVINLFYQILEEGKIKNSKGREVRFNNVVVIMTSNIGFEKNGIGFNKKTDSSVISSLKGYFNTAFINRIDNIIVFDRLDDTSIKCIIRKRLEYIRDKYKDINIDINDNVIDEIVDKCEFYEFGARRIDKIISKDIENFIIDGVIRGDKDIYIDSIVKKNITS